MKRLHVHVSVKDLAASIRFYQTLFGAEPAVTKTDYAKWMLEDPRLNFAISTGRQPVGVNHLGFQVDSAGELRRMRAQLTAADARLILGVELRHDPVEYGGELCVAQHGIGGAGHAQDVTASFRVVHEAGQ